MNVYNENITVLGKFDFDNHQRLLAKANKLFLVEDENSQYSFTYDLFAEKEFIGYALEKLFSVSKKRSKYEFVFIESVVCV
jgi:hypothetical protein